MQVPPVLAAYRQFVPWKAVPSRTKPGKTDKFPTDLSGNVVDGQDPANWYNAQEILDRGLPLGFVFSELDPFFFLDIDDAVTPEGGWSQQALTLCQQFAGCMVEVSHSGTGLHIIGSLPAPLDHGCRNKELKLELYSSGRFVALTGKGLSGDPGHCLDLTGFAAHYFPPVDKSAPVDWQDGPCDEWSGPTDDAELLQKMLASKPSASSMFGGKATVADLWAGETDCYGGDHSAADAALCAHLAFWTGRDCGRMDRLFRQSGLMRDKWDERRGALLYSEKTIIHAVTNCKNVYVDRQTAAAAAAADNEFREGMQFLSVPSQVDHFDGCVYVRSEHAVLIPDGSLLKKEQFRVVYGGYLFSMDASNEKTTNSAWEAFTESRGYRFTKVHSTCFRPEISAGAIVEEENQTMVNVYVPIHTDRKHGDPAPFLNHIAALLPNAQDQQILLAYLAALVQYPGVKFQWMPLLQGVEGNGKSLIITAIAHAVGRRYTHLPNAHDISNKFNAWLVGKLFIGIEEIYTKDRIECIETLKPLITNSRVDIQGKGDNQETGDNRANFIATTNHQDAIRKTNRDRRYCVFFTAQQEESDLQRDGMTGRYFPDLYDWLRREGFAIVNQYLRDYKIPDELNPATLCQRAPVTSSTDAAIQASMGPVEQEIVEAVAEGRPGFAGGWISSYALDQLLEHRRNISHNKRKEMMQALGYIPHPQLVDGRVNNPIVDCNGKTGKPRLYVKQGHLAANLTNGPEITRHYLDAQAGVTTAAVKFVDSSVNKV